VPDGEPVAWLGGVSATSSLLAAAVTRGRNLPALALAALGCLLAAPLLIGLGLFLYAAAVASEWRRLTGERLPPPQALGDFEVRLMVRGLAEARADALRAVASASPSLAPQMARLPALLDEVEREARPLVVEADRLGCFLFYRARRPELERESRQLAADITRAPAAARDELQATRNIVLHELAICDELGAERERLLAALTHVATLLRALPVELARLSLREAQLRGACDERSLHAPLESTLAELREATALRHHLHQELLARR
jgi:hypothetical protein